MTIWRHFFTILIFFSTWLCVVLIAFGCQIISFFWAWFVNCFHGNLCSCSVNKGMILSGPAFVAYRVSTHNVALKQAVPFFLVSVDCLVHIEKRNTETWAALVIYVSTHRKLERLALHTEKRKQVNVHFGLSSIIHFTVFADWDQFFDSLVAFWIFFKFEECFSSSSPSWIYPVVIKKTEWKTFKTIRYCKYSTVYCMLLIWVTP